MIACFASIGVALAIRRGLKPITDRSSGGFLFLLNTTSSFVACASSAFLNAWFMRSTELTTGVNFLHPETEEPCGLSSNTARKAVLQTAISRIFLNFTIFIPPVVMVGLENYKMMPTSFYPKQAVTWSLCIFELYIAASLGLSLYPRMGTIELSELEPEW
jgi:hypothetical protein